MATIECGTKQIVLDQRGFLTNPNDWSVDVAQAIAQHEGLETLSNEQMAIIKFLREYYKNLPFE